jgi:hypothetical protein
LNNLNNISGINGVECINIIHYTNLSIIIDATRILMLINTVYFRQIFVHIDILFNQLLRINKTSILIINYFIFVYENIL